MSKLELHERPYLTEMPAGVALGPCPHCGAVLRLEGAAIARCGTCRNYWRVSLVVHLERVGR